MNKLVLLSLMLSAAFAATACYRYQTMSVGPFFIESDGTLASYQPSLKLYQNDVEIDDKVRQSFNEAYRNEFAGE